MKICVFTRGEKSHSYKYEKAFLSGLESHGHKPTLSHWADYNQDVDLAVVWGVHHTPLIKHIKDTKKDYLVLERGYIGDRTEYTSCGFNGLNGHADFVNKNSDDKRIHLFEELLQPERTERGDYIIIMGQIPYDASVKHIGFNYWLDNTYKMLKAITDRRIYYRPHPLYENPYIPEGMQVIHGDLHHVIHRAHCIITLNSNTGVDSILAGVPTISMDKGSMVYNITPHDLSALFSLKLNDRTQWFNDMSYTQWGLKDMASGATWEHLKKYYK